MNHKQRANDLLAKLSTLDVRIDTNAYQCYVLQALVHAVLSLEETVDKSVAKNTKAQKKRHEPYHEHH